MSRNFEKLIEYIINSDETRARKLFHEIVVSKSRNIYESFEQMDETYGEEEMEEGVGDFIDEVEADETADLAMEADMEPESDDMGDDMDMVMGDDDMGDDLEADDMDMDMGDDLEADDMGDDMGDDTDHEDMEDRVVDLEDAIEELKAEFEKLMADEGDDEAEDESAEETESEDEDEDEVDADEEVEEGLIREYTEKAPAPVHSEEGSVNKKSTVAKKNDMGGTTANIVKGGEAKGRPAPSAKPMGVNDPKAAGKSAFKSQAPKPVAKEESGINKSSVLESKKTKKK